MNPYTEIGKAGALTEPDSEEFIALCRRVERYLRNFDSGDEVGEADFDDIFTWSGVSIFLVREVLKQAKSLTRLQPSYAEGYAKAIEDAVKVADGYARIIDITENPEAAPACIAASIRALAGKDEA